MKNAREHATDRITTMRLASLAIEPRPSGGDAWRDFMDWSVPSGVQSRVFSLRSLGGVVLVTVSSSTLLGPFAPPEYSVYVYPAEPPLQISVPPNEGEAVSAAGAPSGRALTAGQQIDDVQLALSLTVSQIAEIVGVKRASIHNWIRDDRPAPRSGATAKRLRDLYELSLRWRSLSNLDPRGFTTIPIVEVGDEQLSLVDLLRRSAWDTGLLESALGRIAAVLAERAAIQSDSSTSASSLGMTSDSSAPRSQENEAKRDAIRAAVRRARLTGR